jgi:S1-C subfamily serine protease
MSMSRLSAISLLLVALASQPAGGQDRAPKTLDGAEITQKLWAATVTVRVTPPADEPKDEAKKAEATDASTDDSASDESDAPQVSVFSGVSLGDGLIVTFHTAPAGSRFEAILPDGRSAEARLRVVDLFSGLSLLELTPAKSSAAKSGEKPTDLAAIKLAEELPPVGSNIYSAAAAGIEKPVISRGILSQVDRVLSGTGLPPLLQCDLRTTDTSAGAAVVDESARLIGIIAVTTSPEKGSSWPYAVPVRHVLRVLNARDGQNLVVLRERQLARMGLSLFAPGDEEHKDEVRVERVEEGGPAAKAGLKQGDVVLECDGVKVSYVYQVTSILRKKFPGDLMKFVVKSGDATKKLSVPLAGGAVVKPEQLASITGPLYVQQLVGSREGRNFRLRSGIPIPLAMDPDADLPAAEPSASPADPHDPLLLLSRQVQAFGAVIEKLRLDLRKRDELLERYRREIELLREEMESRQPNRE